MGGPREGGGPRTADEGLRAKAHASFVLPRWGDLPQVTFDDFFQAAVANRWCFASAGSYGDPGACRLLHCTRVHPSREVLVQEVSKAMVSAPHRVHLGG